MCGIYWEGCVALCRFALRVRDGWSVHCVCMLHVKCMRGKKQKDGLTVWDTAVREESWHVGKTMCPV